MIAISSSPKYDTIVCCPVHAGCVANVGERGAVALTLLSRPASYKLMGVDLDANVLLTPSVPLNSAPHRPRIDDDPLLNRISLVETGCAAVLNTTRSSPFIVTRG